MIVYYLLSKCWGIKGDLIIKDIYYTNNNSALLDTPLDGIGMSTVYRVLLLYLVQNNNYQKQEIKTKAK